MTKLELKIRKIIETALSEGYYLRRNEDKYILKPNEHNSFLDPYQDVLGGCCIVGILATNRENRFISPDSYAENLLGIKYKNLRLIECGFEGFYDMTVTDCREKSPYFKMGAKLHSDYCQYR